MRVYALREISPLWCKQAIGLASQWRRIPEPQAAGPPPPGAGVLCALPAGCSWGLPAAKRSIGKGRKDTLAVEEPDRLHRQHVSQVVKFNVDSDKSW